MDEARGLDPLNALVRHRHEERRDLLRRMRATDAPAVIIESLAARLPDTPAPWAAPHGDPGPWPEDLEPYADVDMGWVPGTEHSAAAAPLLFLPVQQGYEALAWLHYGNFNACPPAALHVAMLRRWQERFGAELAVVGHDRLLLSVERPPRDRQAALELAWEMEAYDSDLVEQGVGSVAALAALLVDRTVWSFWWD